MYIGKALEGKKLTNAIKVLEDKKLTNAMKASEDKKLGACRERKSGMRQELVS